MKQSLPQATPKSQFILYMTTVRNFEWKRIVKELQQKNKPLRFVHI